jgi:DNA-binding transcriptional MocR family regulator
MTINQSTWVPDLSRAKGPKYRAIADALASDIKSGALPAGARLPPQRELAWALGVTLGTVTRGYQEAERRGLVGGEVGRGTFVRPPVDHNRAPRADAMPTDWYSLDAPDDTDDEGAPINMQFNFPPGDLGVDDLRAALVDLSRDPKLGKLLGYQPPSGTGRQIEAAQAWFAKRGLDAVPEDGIVITAGAHNGILAVLSTLCRSGGRVATERLVYPGMRAVARMLGLELVPVDLDAEGLRPDSLEAVLSRGGIDAIYCVPTLQNPTNATMSEERRLDIARVAEAHGVPVVEDDLFGMLPHSAPAPLTRHLPDLGYCVTSLSKSVGPGLRVGFTRCPPRAREQVAASVRASTWMAAPLTVEIAGRWILDGTAERILERRRAHCASRRAIALETLGHRDIDLPEAAVHGWLHLPDPWHAAQFVATAKEEGVVLSSAHAFSIGRDRSPFAVRVCLGPPRTEDRLREGLTKLDEILHHRDPIDEHAVM